MRLVTDGETFGFQTEPGDAELARATKDALDAGLTIAGHLTGRGTCEECGEKARLRDLAIQADDGGLTRLSVCADCQEAKTAALIQRANHEQIEPEPDEQAESMGEFVGEKVAEATCRGGPEDVGEIDPGGVGGDG